MDVTEAREHLEMADAILRRVPRLARPSGDLLVTWGIVAALLDVIVTMFVQHRLPQSVLWVNPILLICAIAYTSYRARAEAISGNRAWVDVQLGRLFGAVFIVGFLASFGGNALFTTLGSEALWSILFSGILLYVGFCGDRMALIGGSILALSVPAAVMAGANGGYVLAAGFLVGYAGLGILYRLTYADG